MTSTVIALGPAFGMTWFDMVMFFIGMVIAIAIIMLIDRYRR